MNFRNTAFRLLLLPAVAAVALLSTSCTGPRLNYYNEDLALSRYREAIMLFPPLGRDALPADYRGELGKYYQMALSRYTQGQITCANTIPDLKSALQPGNLMINGTVNMKEVTAIARTVGGNSALTIRVIEFKRYPPFRMVVEIIWLDCLSGNMIARMYDDIDMTDTETSYRFDNYIGDGYARSLYEQFTHYKALAETAALKPTVFMQFVADYTIRKLTDQVGDS
ncbi:MAG: hypothetical protein PHQ27_11395, partial [Victivallales bacterium]|nr:hypothetical protein [Victivallales bacterium]